MLSSGHERTRPETKGGATSLTHRTRSEIIGNVQVIQEISRTKAASLLQPPVTTRTLQRYLELAALFLPSFSNFQDPETGYLNRFAKLTTWHLPRLQRIRLYARHKGLQQLQLALSKDPQYFETGEINHDQDNHRSSPVLECNSQKIA